MAKVRPESSEVNARIVYWGIEGAGKRTSLQGVYRKLRPDHRGEMREVPTRIDPGVTYTVLPIELGDVGGMRTRIEMIAMPSGAEHAPTRKQLLDEVDGVVLVLDSQAERAEENLASLEELSKALSDYARSIDEIPLVVQYNKRDLVDAFAIEDLHRRLGLAGATVFEAVATDGTGLLQALSTISKKVIRFLREQSMNGIPAAAMADPAEAPAAVPAQDPREAMEEAILAEANHPELLEANEGSDAAAIALEDQAWGEMPDDLDAPLGARIGANLSIVSVGEASRADARSVRIPLVLGDEDGETSSVVLTIRLDPLVDGNER
ncbi:MAG: ADP-ribosylation factor-like protein [Myxococcota bacterium]